MSGEPNILERPNEMHGSHVIPGIGPLSALALTPPYEAVGCGYYVLRVRDLR